MRVVGLDFDWIRQGVQANQVEWTFGCGSSGKAFDIKFSGREFMSRKKPGFQFSFTLVKKLSYNECN